MVALAAVQKLHYKWVSVETQRPVPGAFATVWKRENLSLNGTAVLSFREKRRGHRTKPWGPPTTKTVAQESLAFQGLRLKRNFSGSFNEGTSTHSRILLKSLASFSFLPHCHLLCFCCAAGVLSANLVTFLWHHIWGVASTRHGWHETQGSIMAGEQQAD